jgi:hypothetical protein
MFGLNWKWKDKIEEDYQEWSDNYLEQERLLQQNTLKRRRVEQKLRLLEISSNCSVPGEPSSRTIERAVELKRYIDESTKVQ